MNGTAAELPEVLQSIVEIAPDGERALRLFDEALTHPTFVNEHSGGGHRDNQRLELLGDAVLGLVITRALFDALPHADEGLLSRSRASVVNEAALASAARAIGLGAVLRLGRGEALNGGRERARTLADALEAVIAAAWIAVGSGPTEAFVVKILDSALHAAIASASALVAHEAVDARAKDAKSVLQEIVQRGGGPPPTYQIEATTGPVHDRVFRVRVIVGGVAIGAGEGPSRRAAEMSAAAHALDAVNRDPRLIDRGGDR